MTGPSRGRLKYEVAGRAMRHSIAKAQTATPAEKVILAAVHLWTISYSRATDRVSLGQLAVTAGLWDGPARDCPRSITRRVGQRLRRLHELGAITYEPGGGEHGRGYVSTISVTLDPRDEKGDPDENPSDEKGDSEGDPFGDQKGYPESPEGGPAESQKGDPVGPPPEKYSEKYSEQPAASPSVVPSASDEHVDGAAADDDDEAQIKAEARRRWAQRNSGGAGLGIGVLRLIEQDVRDERSSWSGASHRELLESYWHLGRNRRGIATEAELRAELAHDFNVICSADLLAAAMAGLRDEQAIG